MLTASAVMDTDVRGDEADCDCATATPDTPFTELCALSARLRHPVAVLDEKEELVGVHRWRARGARPQGRGSRRNRRVVLGVRGTRSSGAGSRHA